MATAYPSSVAADVSTKFGTIPDFINDFGCVGDGATDDTVKANNALVSIAGSGKPAYIYLPSGYNLAVNYLMIPPGAEVHILGQGKRSIVTFLGTPAGTGRLIMPPGSQGVHISGLAFEGRVVAPVLIDYSTNPIPTQTNLKTGSTFWIQGGTPTGGAQTSDIEISNCWVNHTEGYLCYIDATGGTSTVNNSLSKIHIERLRSRNSRNNWFSGGGSAAVYGGYGGGILVASDGQYSNCEDLMIRLCRFDRHSGNVIWMWSPLTALLNRNISVVQNYIRVCALSGIQMASVDGGLEEGNVIEGYGYASTADNDAFGFPRWLYSGGVEKVPVGFDTSGLALKLVRRGNRAWGNGNGYDLDGMGDGICDGNHVVSSWFCGNPYRQDIQCGRNGSGVNTAVGINAGNSNGLAGASQLTISNNRITGFAAGAIAGNCLRFSLVSHNTIDHPGRMSTFDGIPSGGVATSPPITLRNIVPAAGWNHDVNNSFGVTVTGNKIHWPVVLGGGWAINEDGGGHAFANTDKNYVFANRLSGNCAEFEKHVSSGSSGALNTIDNQGALTFSSVTPGAAPYTGAVLVVEGTTTAGWSTKFYKHLTGKQQIALIDDDTGHPVVLAGPGTSGSASLAAGGVIATGNRSTASVGDLIATGLAFLDGGLFFPTSPAYDMVPKQNQLVGSATLNAAGLRYDPISNDFQKCISVAAGLPVWVPLAGGTTNYTGLGTYDWSFTSGAGVTGTLGSPGVNTLTFATAPIGGDFIHIHGGTGTPEMVTASWAGNVATFTSVFPHSGAWIASSQTKGCQEQLNAGAYVLPMAIVGSNDWPGFGQTDASLLVGRNTNTNNDFTAANRITVGVQSIYSGAHGTAAGVHSVMQVYGNLSGNGTAAFYGVIYSDAPTTAGMIALHGEVNCVGPNTGVSVNAEGRAVAGSHIGLLSNTGIGPSTEYSCPTASWSALGVATYFTTIAHDILVGGYVFVKGATNTAWNFDRLQVTAVTAFSVSVNMPVNPGSYTGGGAPVIAQSPAYFGCNLKMHHQHVNAGGGGLLFEAAAGRHPYAIRTTDVDDGRFDTGILLETKSVGIYEFMRFSVVDNGAAAVPSLLTWYHGGVHLADFEVKALWPGPSFQHSRITMRVNASGVLTDTVYVDLSGLRVASGTVIVNGSPGNSAVTAVQGYMQSREGFYCPTAEYGLHCFDGTLNGNVFIHGADHDFYVTADQNIHLTTGSGGSVVIGSGLSEFLTPYANVTASLGATSKRWLKTWAQDLDLSGGAVVTGAVTIGGLLSVGTAGINVNGQPFVDFSRNVSAGFIAAVGYSTGGVVGGPTPGYVNTGNGYKVGGVEVIDSSQQATFLKVTITGNPSINAAGSVITPLVTTSNVLANSGQGMFIGANGSTVIYMPGTGTGAGKVGIGNFPSTNALEVFGVVSASSGFDAFGAGIRCGGITINGGFVGQGTASSRLQISFPSTGGFDVGYSAGVPAGGIPVGHYNFLIVRGGVITEALI